MNEPHPDYNSPISLKTFLDANGMAMQKKFGQNFLVNSTARKQLINYLDIKDSTSVWEVGPGLGSMTDEILTRGATLSVFEIDRGFASFIRRFFCDFISSGKLQVIEGDVLKTWKKQQETAGIPDRFFGNLPYNIAASIIGDTIEAGIRFDKAVVTVQKEVAQRMTAAPGTEDYSAFSVLCQWAYDIKPVLDLAGGNFWPRPNVDSRAVLMTRKNDFPVCRNPDLFVKLEHALFVSRRKTVKNNLTVFLADSTAASKILADTGIDPMKRAENLSVTELLSLSDITDDAIISRKA